MSGEIIASAVLIAAVLYIGLRQLASWRAERALRDSGSFGSEIIENAGEGIVVYDPELRMIVWNRFMEELTGLPPSEVLGRRAIELFPELSEQGVDELLRRALKGDAVTSPDVRYAFAGVQQSGWISGTFRPYRDSAGKVVGVIGTIRDITERKEAEQQIEYQAYHDALTGLANRRLFQEHLTIALALAARRARLVAVLFLDLDHFKVVNDSLGHTIGDSLLREIAARLKASVREGDTVARVGGDEFTIVLQDLEKKEDAGLVAQKVLHTVAQPVEIGGHRLYVTTSIGITIFPDDGDDAETLLKNADNAMYRAKEQGRNRYEMSTMEMNRSMHERLTLESGLHLAMERNEFELYYQPVYDITTMDIVGMEALIRWNHPERGLLLPAAFIHVAEERGHIVLIGDWAIRQACEQAKNFCGIRPNFRVAVNISARQFRDDSLVETIRSALRDAHLDPNCLEIEITESAAMADVALTLDVLKKLRSTGVTVAIDDFGTGHSSLSYLKQFPIDALKIDRTFVEDLPDRFEDAAIVRAVIQLAHGLNLRVVAEGVETKPQLDFLTRHECREVQGFFFSYPLPAKELETLLVAQRR